MISHLANSKLAIMLKLVRQCFSFRKKKLYNKNHINQICFVLQRKVKLLFRYVFKILFWFLQWEIVNIHSDLFNQLFSSLFVRDIILIDTIFQTITLWPYSVDTSSRVWEERNEWPNLFKFFLNNALCIHQYIFE